MQYVPQTLTAEQQAQARENIGALGEGDIDCIPAPTIAEVGQTIVVSAVDENGKPTAWQAAAMASGGGGEEVWRDVATVELSEEATTIDITLDDNGEPFSLKKYEILCFFWGGSESTADSFAYFGVNNTSKGSQTPYWPFYTTPAMSPKAETGRRFAFRGEYHPDIQGWTHWRWKSGGAADTGIYQDAWRTYAGDGGANMSYYPLDGQPAHGFRFAAGKWGIGTQIRIRGVDA